MLRPENDGAVSAAESDSQASAAPVLASLLTARVGALLSGLFHPNSFSFNLHQFLILNVTQDSINVEVAWNKKNVKDDSLMSFSSTLIVLHIF